MAKIELGKRFNELPKAQGARTDLAQPIDIPVDKLKPKSEVIAELGFTQKQVERFQQMAKNPDVVQAAMAKENLVAGAEMTNTGLQKSVKAVNTQKEIAKAAGVSHDTIAKVEKIETQATPEVKAALKAGDLSINAAYNKVKAIKKLKEIVDAKENIAAQVANNSIATDKNGYDVYEGDTLIDDKFTSAFHFVKR